MMSFESFVRLGWSFFRTVLRGLFPRRSQLPRFEAQYRPDGVLSTAAAEVAVQDGAQRCFACGACDVAALERGEFGALGPLGPMGFVVGVSRQAGIDLGVAVLRRQVLGRCHRFLGLDRQLVESKCHGRLPLIAHGAQK